MDDRERLQALLAENAEFIGEEVKIGAHYLRDGRVRIYDLDKGKRQHPYKEYDSIERALWACGVANQRARRARELIDTGIGVDRAVSLASKEIS